jgi:hypothetical protein
MQSTNFWRNAMRKTFRHINGITKTPLVADGFMGPIYLYLFRGLPEPLRTIAETLCAVMLDSLECVGDTLGKNEHGPIES